MLQKAHEQIEEQEDEIKKLNEFILDAKCHAIRDAQLIEKKEIKSEVLEEEKRSVPYEYSNCLKVYFYMVCPGGLSRLLQ